MRSLLAWPTASRVAALSEHRISQFPIPDSRFPIPDSRFPTP
ncbi:hypothetical protein [Moorena sp. SIO3B2]|nr:hypothetical protein [Moorena sp. SIO3B2]